MSSDKVNILMIEDLEAAQLAATHLFIKLNCTVQVISSANTAFSKILSEHFDIIFIDLMLPGLDGFEIASTLRVMQRSRKRIPLIAVTANSSENLEAKTKTSGFDDFLIQPLTVESIRHMLFKHINRTDYGDGDVDAQ